MAKLSFKDFLDDQPALAESVERTDEALNMAQRRKRSIQMKKFANCSIWSFARFVAKKQMPATWNKPTSQRTYRNVSVCGILTPMGVWMQQS